MKFLRYLLSAGVMLLVGVVCWYPVKAALSLLPGWLLRALADSFLGNILLQLGAYALWLELDAIILRWLQRLYLGAKGKNSPTPTPRPRKEPPARQTVPATVTAKRSKTKRRPRSRPEFHYHAAFRLAEGQELWFRVSGQEYRRIAEGNRGQLTFQGKAYISFLKDGEGIAGGGTSG